ncbi:MULTISPECIES: hypothetical protein [Bradyrhizobium]|uniref:Uncharacterized protein n=1 Tax=Bradyrhizobium brasilense TaxID=1419277 RepID=A0ABY8J927_9BRAD|nr:MULTISPECIES: hypothetical protein [Bradyrhizobium]KRP95149.1 hypothetical protein AOQ73_23985 [Bradyrhizobium pachyrhizi]MCC8946483.1 hypothetical protein [Bradyrhizobium brasilense]MCP1833189.1 hypothetical protein [Bradyrhizobium sp. USDA 4545]MCP1917933.1 hypothetical protein [Bradyrhizobium sp. USDA 4532]MCP3412593.1 hypothetical protein [Bradyrhizobium brasilense]
MRKHAATVLIGVFCSLVTYFSAARLYQWAETGQLAVLSRKTHDQPEFVSWGDDRPSFVLLFALYLFFLKNGLLGMLVTCREVWLRGRGWEP